MAKKRYLDLVDGVEIYKSGKSYTNAQIAAHVTNKLGVASGIATLGSDGKVPSAQLPSFVDDVIDSYVVAGATALSAGWLSATSGGSALTPETGKIYVVLSEGDYQNKTYRWSGTTYVEISQSLALGETSSTAYRGDRGKAAYDHSQDSSRLTTATASGLYKVASTAEGHIASLTTVVKSDLTGLGVEDASNKVTAFQTTPDDTHYPSEKLVKDSLDTKADKVASATNGHLAGLDANGNLTDSGKALSDLAAKNVLAAANDGQSDATSETSDPYINLVQDGAVKSRIQVKGAGTVSVKGENGVLTITGAEDTHHQAKAVVCGSDSGKANAAATNGNVRINIVENDTVRSSNPIVGKVESSVEFVNVASDSNGKITIGVEVATAAQMAAAIGAYDNGYDGETGDAAVAAYIASLDA